MSETEKSGSAKISNFMKVGFIGLGKMGSRMAVKLLKEGHSLVVWNRSQQAVDELRIKNQESWKREKMHNSKFMIHDSMAGELEVAKTIEGLVKKLKSPRIVWLMLPAHSTGSGQAGSPTQEILDEVSKYIEKEDIVIDGGNSHFKDTEKRYRELKTKGIRFLGIGVSGGIIAEKQGYPMMVGGDVSAYQYITTILDSLAKPNGGYEYFGEGGAGHFIKMVHNAIEYGYMQAIGEGFGLLDSSDYNFDLKRIAEIYQKGTLISGFMMERTIEALGSDPKLEKITGFIGKASGETIWAVEEAEKKKLLFAIIKRSLTIRNQSGSDPKIQKSFAARMVSALRNAFGGHPVRQAQGKKVKKK